MERRDYLVFVRTKPFTNRLAPQGSEHCGYRLSAHRIAQLGIQFRQWREREAPFAKSRMRNFQLFRLHHRTPVEQNVDIDACAVR